MAQWVSWGGLARELGRGGAFCLPPEGPVRRRVGTVWTVVARVPGLLQGCCKDPGREHATGQNPNASARPAPARRRPPPAASPWPWEAGGNRHLTRQGLFRVVPTQRPPRGRLPEISLKWSGPWAIPPHHYYYCYCYYYYYFIIFSFSVSSSFFLASRGKAGQP